MQRFAGEELGHWCILAFSIWRSTILGPHIIAVQLWQYTHQQVTPTCKLGCDGGFYSSCETCTHWISSRVNLHTPQMAVFNLVYQAAGYLYLSKGKSLNGVNPRRDFMGGLVPDQPHIPLRVQGGVFYVRIKRGWWDLVVQWKAVSQATTITFCVRIFLGWASISVQAKAPLAKQRMTVLHLQWGPQSSKSNKQGNREVSVGP